MGMLPRSSGRTGNSGRTGAFGKTASPGRTDAFGRTASSERTGSPGKTDASGNTASPGRTDAFEKTANLAGRTTAVAHAAHVAYNPSHPDSTRSVGLKPAQSTSPSPDSPRSADLESVRSTDPDSTRSAGLAPARSTSHNPNPNPNPHPTPNPNPDSTRSEAILIGQAVRRAQTGDREAFAFLYARYADNIYGYVRSIVQNHHEAEDVTQQVFAKLFAVIGKYEQREVPFFAWILRVARNVAVDHIRGQRLVPVEEVRTSDEGGGDPAAGGRMRELTDALAGLPADQREVLVLRHFAGLSPPEIAERTGRTEGSIHGLHHRGRRALQADLQARGMAPVTFLADDPSSRPHVAGA